MRSGRRESHKSGIDGAAVKCSTFVLMAMAVALSFTGEAHAKVAAGVSGIVTDSSGAVVAGATITMKATETGVVETRQTNGDRKSVV